MSLNLPLHRTLAAQNAHFETLFNEFEEHRKVFESQREAFLAHQKAFENLEKAFEERKKIFESQKKKYSSHMRKMEKKFRHRKIDPLQHENMLRSYQNAINAARENGQSAYADSLATDLSLLRGDHLERRESLRRREIRQSH